MMLTSILYILLGLSVSGNLAQNVNVRLCSIYYGAQGGSVAIYSMTNENPTVPYELYWNRYANGSLLPNTVYYKDYTDGGTLYNTRFSVVDNFTLIIHNTTASDFDDYTYEISYNDGSSYTPKTKLKRTATSNGKIVPRNTFEGTIFNAQTYELSVSAKNFVPACKVKWKCKYKDKDTIAIIEFENWNAQGIPGVNVSVETNFTLIDGCHQEDVVESFMTMAISDTSIFPCFEIIAQAYLLGNPVGDKIETWSVTVGEVQPECGVTCILLIILVCLCGGGLCAGFGIWCIPCECLKKCRMKWCKCCEESRCKACDSEKEAGVSSSQQSNEVQTTQYPNSGNKHEQP